MFATQILTQENVQSELKNDQEVEIVGYISVEDKDYEIKKGENKIGRDPSVCSVVIENFTVSKLHAIIESEGIDDTFIYDVGSTNQTRLGKKCLKPHYRYKIDDGAVITFGNIVSKFKVFKNATKKTYLEITPPDSDECFDIFEIPTQGNLILVQESQKLNEFDKLPNNFKTFKISKQQCLADKQKNFSQLSSIVSEESQHHIEKSRSNHSSKFEGFQNEDSNIFNLSTQNQILQFLNVNENTSSEWNRIIQKDKQSECNDNAKILNLPLDIVKEKTDIIESVSKEKKEQLKYNFSRVDSNINTEVLEPVDSQCDTEVFLKSSGPDTRVGFCLDNVNKILDPSTSKQVKINDSKGKIENSQNKNSTEECLNKTQKLSDLLIEESSDNDTESNLEISLENSLQRSKSDDAICTQLFDDQDLNVKVGTNEKWNEFMKVPVTSIELTEKRVKGVSFKSSDNDNNFLSVEKSENYEDLVATQIFEKSPRCVENEERESWYMENSPDLLSPFHSEQISEDFKSTQILPEKNWENIKKEVNFDRKERISTLSIDFKKENEIIETLKWDTSRFSNNSADETESDLEIIDTEESTEFFKGDLINEKSGCEKETRVEFCNVTSQVETVEMIEINDSQSSYVFTVEENLLDHKIKSEPSSNVSSHDEDDTVLFELEQDDVNSFGNLAKTKEKQEKTTNENKSTISNPSIIVGHNKCGDSDEDSDCIFTQEPSEVTSFQVEKLVKIHANTKNIVKDSKTKTLCQEYNKSKQETEKNIETPLKRARNNEEKIFSSSVKKSKLSKQPKEGYISDFLEQNKEARDNAQVNSSLRKKSRRKTDIKRKKFLSVREKKSFAKQNTLSQWFSSEKQKEATENTKQTSKNVKTPNRRSRNNREKRLQKSESLKDEFFSRSSRMQIAFTGFESETMDGIITELGGEKISELSGGDVVITDKVRRTVKFLCALSAGIPISSPEWLLASWKEKKFLNPWDHILKDENSEKKWEFDLKFSLHQSKKSKLFKGLTVFATKSTKPSPTDLFDIVKLGGGKLIFERPKVWTKKTIVVSCLEDKDCWPPPEVKHVVIVHYECILVGVLRQKLDFDAYKLSHRMSPDDASSF